MFQNVGRLVFKWQHWSFCSKAPCVLRIASQASSTGSFYGKQCARCPLRRDMMESPLKDLLARSESHRKVYACNAGALIYPSKG